MPQSSASTQNPACPSAQPDIAASMVLAVIGGTAEAPRLQHLTHPLPVTESVLALAQPVNPTEVFRIAAPCAGLACQHFDGTQVRLAARIVRLLPTVVEALPALCNMADMPLVAAGRQGSLPALSASCDRISSPFGNPAASRRSTRKLLNEVLPRLLARQRLDRTNAGGSQFSVSSGVSF